MNTISNRLNHMAPIEWDLLEHLAETGYERAVAPNQKCFYDKLVAKGLIERCAGGNDLYKITFKARNMIKSMLTVFTESE